MGMIEASAGGPTASLPAGPDAARRSEAEVAAAPHGPDIGRGTAMLLLAVAVVVGAALRVTGGNDQLWYDEIHTLVDSIREPLAVIVTHFPSNNDHVFYSVLSHISIALGGETR